MCQTVTAASGTVREESAQRVPWRVNSAAPVGVKDLPGPVHAVVRFLLEAARREVVADGDLFQECDVQQELQSKPTQRAVLA